MALSMAFSMARRMLLVLLVWLWSSQNVYSQQVAPSNATYEGDENIYCLQTTEISMMARRNIEPLTPNAKLNPVRPAVQPGGHPC